MNLSSLVRFFSRGGRRRAVNVNVNLSRRESEGGETAFAARRHLHAIAAAHPCAWKAPAALLNPLTTPIPTTQTYSTTSAGGNVSLGKLLMGKLSKKLLWEEIVPGMARPSPFFRLAMRGVYQSLSKLQREGRWHGNLKPENIIFPGFNMAKPILVEFSDVAGDIAEDFKSLGAIITEVFGVSDCRKMDPETTDFIQFLKSNNAGKMHYWMLSAIDREQFFLDINRRCRYTIKEIFKSNAPCQVPLDGRVPSKYFEVFVAQNRKERDKKPIIWHNVLIAFATELIRHYFEHYGDAKVPYNEWGEETTVTLHEAELDFYRYYPGYFPAFYKELQKLNIEYILS